MYCLFHLIWFNLLVSRDGGFTVKDSVELGMRSGDAITVRTIRNILHIKKCVI